MGLGLGLGLGRAGAGVRFRPARQTGTGGSSCVHSAGRTCSARQERAPTPEQVVDNMLSGDTHTEREQGVGVRVVKRQATMCGAHLLARLGAELPGAEPATQARRHDEVSAAPEHRDRRGAELERRCCRRCCHRGDASTRSRELAWAFCWRRMQMRDIAAICSLILF